MRENGREREREREEDSKISRGSANEMGNESEREREYTCMRVWERERDSTGQNIRSTVG
jgi:hypothetical protein